MKAHFVKYKRLLHPVDSEVSVSKRLKVKEVKELYHKFVIQRDKATRAEAQVKALEALLKRALLTEDYTSRGHVALEYMKFLRDSAPPMLGEWTGYRWLDTNFIPKDTPMSIDQTTMTLDQWGDSLDITDAKTYLAKKLIKRARSKR